MQTLDPSFVAALQAAPDNGVAPVYFMWFYAKDRETGTIEEFGLWTGDEDISITVQSPLGGVTQARDYLGGVNLEVGEIVYSGSLVDEPLGVKMSQIAPAAQQLIRGYELRLAECELHATSLNGGAFFSTPQLQHIGVVDDAQIATPEAGSDGSISLVIRSDLMAQYTKINPNKSSDAHQKQRLENDEFSRYAGVVQSRDLQWFYKKEG